MRRPLFVVCLFLTAVVWGRLLLGHYESPPKELTRICVQGQVYQKEKNQLYLQSVFLVQRSTSDQAVTSQQKIPINENLICEISRADEVPLGRFVLVEGNFEAFSPATNPGEFDAAQYYRSLHICGRLKKAEIIRQGTDYWHMREFLYRFKKVLQRRLEKVYEEGACEILNALLLGNKDKLTSETKNLYKQNGILHILSISSLHITILGISLYKLLRKLSLPVCFVAPFVSALLILYGYMTGFSISTRRAVGMFLLHMLGDMVGRTYDVLTALGVLAVSMVISNPFYLQNSGFLLSFASVFGVAMVSPLLSGGRESRVKQEHNECSVECSSQVLKRLHVDLAGVRIAIFEGIKMSALSSLAITLITLPIQLWFYYEVPVYSTLINLMVLPFMKSLLIAGLLSLIPGLGFVGTYATAILRYYEKLCLFFNKLPFHTWNPGKPELWQVILYYLLLSAFLWILCECWKRREDNQYKSGRITIVAEGTGTMERAKGAWGKAEGTGTMERAKGARGKAEGTGTMERAKGAWGKSQEAWRHVPATWQTVIGACAFCLLGFVLFQVQFSRGSRVLFLDVGQGDCCLVEMEDGCHYLFDCGSSSKTKVGKNVLLPALKYYGINRLDGVFVSHPDQDHINGALELFSLAEEKGIKIGKVFLPWIAEGKRREEFGEIYQALEEINSGGKSRAVEETGSGDKSRTVEETGSGDKSRAVEKTDSSDKSRAVEKTGSGGRAESSGMAVPVGYVKSGDVWYCGNAKFSCLHPNKETETKEGNEYSQCILIEFGENLGSISLLLTGDVEGEGEEQLTEALEERNIGGITILKCAHHGSRYSSSKKLIEVVRPEVTLISVGKKNQYGHPHAETLERLEAADSKIYRTDELGAIIFTISTSGEAVVEGYTRSVGAEQ